MIADSYQLKTTVMSEPTPEPIEMQNAKPAKVTQPRSGKYKTTSITFDSKVYHASVAAAKERGYRTLSSYVNYEISKVLGVKL